MLQVFKKAVLICASVAVLAPAAVAAQTAQEYLGLVSSRCEAIKQIIDIQRRSDLVARINKGRAYQEIINQQNSFSQRLRNNKLTSDAFDRQATVVQEGVGRFRAAYNSYDDAVGQLLGIDCKARPQEFVNQLEKVRSLRLAIGVQVASIDTELARYRQEVVELGQEIERLNDAILGGSQ